ncbi:organic cation transporter protein-like [Phlebotomus argentipes]|uniref:organic cation transporter protein-like n=1 Tax=Phlebotomus argentipes TaxID=94469 RepID=UPI002892A0CD|nr:organic cation transporter protein-like [Phlebotomus argentipes]
MSREEGKWDKVLQELGDFGVFQLKNYILISLVVLLPPVYGFSYVFSAADINYRCRIEECEPPGSGFITNRTLLEFSIPQIDGTFSRCNRFGVVNSSQVSCDATNFDRDLSIPCTDFIFDSRKKTIVSEWNLTCTENEWKLAFVGTMANIGQFIALPITGFFSDRFGRKAAFILSTLCCGLCGIIKSFSSSYSMLVLFEFLEMALGSGIYACGYVLGMELVGPSKRAFGTLFINSFYTSGGAILGLVALWQDYWRDMLRWLYFPCLLVVAYFWLIPESVRWLLTMGRQDEASKIIRKAAKRNNVLLSEETIAILHGNVPGKVNPVAKKKKKSYPIASIFSSSALLIRLAICSFCWITNTFVYYGLVINSASFGDDIHTSFILGCLIEIPSFIVSYLVLDRIGRRWTLCSSFLVSGIACLSVIFIGADHTTLRLVMFLIGRFGITISFTSIYLYTTEIFPTELRSSLLSFCSTVGRIGAAVAPQTPLLAKFSKSLPMVLFCGTALTAGALILQAPETLNAKLPDTIQQAEKMNNTSANIQ